MSDWKDRLFSEHTISEAFWSSPSVFHRSFHISVISAAVLFMILVVVFLETERQLGNLSWVMIANYITKFSDLGFNFSTAILGFLIAGFAIFSSITNPKLFWILAELTNDDYPKLSELKFIFFIFMNTFVHFIAFACLCWFSSSVFTQCGVIVRDCSDDSGVSIVMPIVYLFILLIPLYAIILILKLKSFIWSLYQAVLLSIVYSHKIHEETRECKSRSEN